MWIRHATLYDVGLLEISPKVSFCYLVIFSMNFKMCNDNVSVTITWYEIILHFYELDSLFCTTLSLKCSAQRNWVFATNTVIISSFAFGENISNSDY